MHTRTLVSASSSPPPSAARPPSPRPTPRPATTQPGPTRPGAYKVTAKVNKTEPLLNQGQDQGHREPGRPGSAVTLQVKYEDQKTWKTIDHGQLNGSSKVTFKDKVGSVRERRYRVVKPAGAGRAAGQGTAPR